MIPVDCAAILAGGKSSRMGREKALIEWGNQTLIGRVAQVLRPIFSHVCVVTSNFEVARAANIPAIPDHFLARGPVGGIHAALTHFGAPVFIVACDMPFLNGEFIRFMAQNFNGDALIPRSETGIEPLHAIYSPRCAPVLADLLVHNEKMPTMGRVIDAFDARFVETEIARQFDPNLRCFANWNTPSDIAEDQRGT
ncbi:MAG TPA: molybdenum cofactor guanylyltransferase [Abditibacterium sp.]